ncbi:hypothetical protein BABINDRAFT_163401 [Babjeviella inositovora NRRL Y-12698]|uniref:Uncharacterized protein n=1 Tax=Babjeviella inositovora NRRL Y-12698 TaxID=984486 RepID=A0A1E3QJ17_9ASCO|nr:uncharacterized protein BABINDRAFT_163401 [Babjeviella inositovora NRRL Y-12698]ODQ77691.1 hypothetical protein BABINDRAFT_163401 [Babjeviella inositovora NRRL Y-12698]
MAIALNKRIKAVLLLVFTFVSLFYIFLPAPAVINEDIAHHTKAGTLATPKVALSKHVLKDEYTEWYKKDQYIPLTVSSIKPNGNSYTNTLHLEQFSYNDPAFGLCNANTKYSKVEAMFLQIDTHRVIDSLVANSMSLSSLFRGSSFLNSFLLDQSYSDNEYNRDDEITIPAVRLKMDEPNNNCVSTCKKVMTPAQLRNMNRLIREGYGIFYQVGDLPVYYSNIEYNIEFSSKFGKDFFNYGVPLGYVDTTNNRTLYYNHHNFYLHYKKVNGRYKITEMYVAPVSTYREDIDNRWGCALDNPLFLDETEDTTVLYSYSIKYIDVANPQNQASNEDTTLTIPYNYEAKHFRKTWMRVQELIVRTNNKTMVYLMFVFSMLVYLQDGIFNFTASSTVVHFADMRISSAGNTVLFVACVVVFTAHILVTMVVALFLKVVFFHDSATVLSSNMVNIGVVCYIVTAVGMGNFLVGYLKKHSYLPVTVTDLVSAAKVRTALLTFVTFENAGIILIAFFINLIYQRLRVVNFALFVSAVNYLLIAPLMHFTDQVFDTDVLGVLSFLAFNPNHAANSEISHDYTGTLRLPDRPKLVMLAAIAALVSNIPIYLYLTVLNSIVFYNRLVSVSYAEMLFALVSFVILTVCANYIVNVIVFKNHVFVPSKDKEGFEMAVSRSASPANPAGSTGFPEKPIVKIDIPAKDLGQIVLVNVLTNIAIIFLFLVYINKQLLVGSSAYTLVGFSVLYATIASVVSIISVGLSLVTLF